MKIISTTIPDLLIIYPDIFSDERGLFFESFNKKKFEELHFTKDFVQDNQSVSNKNVLRGLHFQKPPYAQGKLVRVVYGSAFDVAVDLRKNSPCYGKHFIIKLSATENNMFWIPEGFAHGFIALQDNTIFNYKTTDYYHKEAEMTLRWNDELLNIPWNITNPIVSEKDAMGLSFNDFISPF